MRHRARLLVELAFALLAPAIAQADATFVQAASGAADFLGTTVITGQNSGTAFGSNLTVGNAVGVVVMWDTATTMTVSGCGASWSTAIATITHANGVHMQAFKAFNVSAGACTITGTASGGTPFGITLVAVEVTGVPTTDPQDPGVTSTNNALTGTAVTLAGLTASANGAFYISVFCDVNDNAQTWTTTGSSPAFTERIDFNGCQLATYAQATAASVTPGATLTTADPIVGMAWPFLATGGGGPSGPPVGSLMMLGVGR